MHRKTEKSDAAGGSSSRQQAVDEVVMCVGLLWQQVLDEKGVGAKEFAGNRSWKNDQGQERHIGFFVRCLRISKMSDGRENF